MSDFVDRTVFISGASSGIGSAVARRFARAGARTILAARRREQLLDLHKELGERAFPLVLDVREPGQIARILEELPATFRTVDVLVNNAGGALGLEPAPEARLEDWETMVDTNIKGLLQLTRLLLPGMVARDRGHVINLGSVAGTYPYRGGNVYGATKAFVHQFSQELRVNLLGKKVRVTCIEPGAVETEFSEVRLRGDREKAKQVYAGFEPLQAADIAEAIYWCAALPAHINVNRLELMPVMQSFAGFQFHRTES